MTHPYDILKTIEKWDREALADLAVAVEAYGYNTIAAEIWDRLRSAELRDLPWWVTRNNWLQAIRDEVDMDYPIATGPRFVVQIASANMPNGCWGAHARVAVLEIEPGTRADFKPTMISERARGVARVVETWERLNVGKTERCAFRRALAAAERLAADLNKVGQR
jgi:hypothetical protein